MEAVERGRAARHLDRHRAAPAIQQDAGGSGPHSRARSIRPAIGINFDTGNSYLSGQDPIAWLEHVKDRLVHLHAKDISVSQSETERGKVTGTPVGCACGDGVIDWAQVIEICRTRPRDIVLASSAARSIRPQEHRAPATVGRNFTLMMETRAMRYILTLLASVIAILAFGQSQTRGADTEPNPVPS